MKEHKTVLKLDVNNYFMLYFYYSGLAENQLNDHSKIQFPTINHFKEWSRYMIKLYEILKSTSYDDTLFSEDTVSAIESAIFIKTVKGIETPYMKCLIREKEIKLIPEEVVRQLYIYKLIHEYNYPAHP